MKRGRAQAPIVRLVNVYRAGRARSGAVRFLYQLLEERPPAANISHSRMPTIGQHRRFVRCRPYRAWYLVESAAPGEWVGSVSVTGRNEIGIAILKAYQRKDYARAALRALFATVRPLKGVPSARRGTFLANVAPGNHRAHRLFKGLGARPIQVTYEL
jgi:RimJ/RimL family protein N-acetyltransferase